MDIHIDSNENDCIKNRGSRNGSAGDAVYGLGLIGAAIFFIGNATTFWMGVLGFLKAIVWPVFLVLEAFKALLG